MDPTDFGWGGLLRWAACGLLTGVLDQLLYVRLLRLLDEQNLIRQFGETFGLVAIFTLSFWLIFHRNFFTFDSGSADRHRDSRSLAWFLMVGGGFIAATGWLVLILIALGQIPLPAQLTPGFGAILIGLSAVLLGAMVSSKASRLMESSLILLVFVLILTGAVLILIKG